LFTADCETDIKTRGIQDIPSKSAKSMASSHWFLFEVSKFLGELKAYEAYGLWLGGIGFDP